MSPAPWFDDALNLRTVARSYRALHANALYPRPLTESRGFDCLSALADAIESDLTDAELGRLLRAGEVSE